VTTATVARTGLSIAPNFGSENLLKWLVETCERPCGRAADERDEHAPVHSITSSARASSVDGTATHGRVVVIAAAALRGLGNSPRHRRRRKPRSRSYRAPR
jgi:hypothetical protein